jgi:hypothetical protein
MNATHLNEHDANQGAQSQGEFLGMTGNSAWYLLGSAGASVLLVIVLWGVLGLSLLLCLTIGLLLCLSSVTYVFTLKNNKPEHYDTDFFEAALIEAGVVRLSFGPRERRLRNPFLPGSDAMVVATRSAAPAAKRNSRVAGRAAPISAPPKATQEILLSDNEPKRKSDEVPTVPLAALERVQAELAATEEILADAISSHEEEDVCV